MMKYNMLSLLGIQECCYFISFRVCFAEVSHQRIEVVHVLVDIASDALFKRLHAFRPARLKEKELWFES